MGAMTGSEQISVTDCRIQLLFWNDNELDGAHFGTSGLQQRSMSQAWQTSAG